MKVIAAIAVAAVTGLGGCMQTGSYGYVGYASPAITSKQPRCPAPLTEHCRHPDSMPERQNATLY